MQWIVDGEDFALLESSDGTWALLQLWIGADADATVTVSQRHLMTTWGWSRERVTRTIEALIAGGWIQIDTSEGRRRSTRYRLTCRGIRPLTASSEAVPAVAKGSVVVKKKADPDPAAAEATRLLHRHAERYTARFGQPFPVAWARDTQVYKRLVRVYGSDSAFLESLQDRFLKQSLDSFAGKRGFSVLQFAAECAGLAAQAGAQALWSVEQTEAFHALWQVGMSESTATALISECSLAVIHAQIAAYERRMDHGQAVSLSRLERAIRENWQEKAEPVDYPAFPAKLTRPDGAESPSDEPNPTPALAEFLSAIAMKV